MFERLQGQEFGTPQPGAGFSRQIEGSVGKKLSPEFRCHPQYGFPDSVRFNGEEYFLAAEPDEDQALYGSVQEVLPELRMRQIVVDNEGTILDHSNFDESVSEV